MNCIFWDLIFGFIFNIQNCLIINIQKQFIKIKIKHWINHLKHWYRIPFLLFKFNLVFNVYNDKTVLAYALRAQGDSLSCIVCIRANMRCDMTGMMMVWHRCVMCCRRRSYVRIQIGRRTGICPVGRSRRKYTTSCRWNACTMNCSRKVQVFSSRTWMWITGWRMHE